MASGTVQRPVKGDSARAVANAARSALVAGAEFWHKNILPFHFQTGAASKYNYAPRTAKYMRRKAYRLHHQRPLEYSGHSRQQAEQDYKITGGSIAGQPSASVAMNMPSYFVQHPRGSTFIDKPAELTRTTEDEKKVIGEVILEEFSRRLGRTMPRSVSSRVA